MGSWPGTVEIIVGTPVASAFAANYMNCNMKNHETTETDMHFFADYQGSCRQVCVNRKNSSVCSFEKIGQVGIVVAWTQFKRV